MSYTATHAMRLKDGKSLAAKVKSVTDGHATRIAALETAVDKLSKALLGITNSVITNVTREG